MPYGIHTKGVHWHFTEKSYSQLKAVQITLFPIALYIKSYSSNCELLIDLHTYQFHAGSVFTYMHTLIAM